MLYFSLERFIELNEEAPPSSPPPVLDEAMIEDEFGGDDDFFAGSEIQSQGLRGQDTNPSQGLLGLDGPVTPLKVELETFFKLPNLPTSNVDILAWWKTQEPVLPLLGEIARKYLCVTASSASAERLFSASGNVVTKLRSSLAPENLELIVYLHENMRKVKMTYDSELLKAPAPGQAPAQVQLDWLIVCLHCFITYQVILSHSNYHINYQVILKSKQKSKPKKKKSLCVFQNKFILKLSSIPLLYK